MGEISRIFPYSLSRGDTVALVAPASPISPEDALVCKEQVEALGYKVKMGETVTQVLHGYEAGDPVVRAHELASVFVNPDIAAVFCVRGGFSACRLLSYIDPDVFRKHPKAFVGYSDITALHLLFNQRARLVTFHGPMVRPNMLVDFDEYSKESLLSVLSQSFGDEYSFRNPDGYSMRTLCGGKARGELVGGNLTVLSALLGTSYALETKGKVLLLEDVGESVPRLARMLEQWRLAGKFDGVAGIVLGDFTDCENPYDSTYGVGELLRDFFAGCGVPVLSGVCTGHAHPMGTIPLGAFCHLDAGRHTLSFSWER